MHAYTTVCAFVVFAACGDDDGGQIDASSSADGAVSAADAGADGAAATCDPDRTRVFPDGGPIEEGQFCDEIIACAASAAEAEAVEEVAPDFACTETDGACRFSCLHPGGTVSPQALAQICAITVVLDPPEEVVCRIFL